MATTDPLEWRLLDTDFSTVLGILPSDGGNLYIELNEPGSGELKIPLNSAIASVVTVGMFAQCNYRGLARGGFLVDNLRTINADGAEGAGQWLSLSGRGALAILDEAIIWDDGTGNTTRKFTGTKASILITLIAEAIARGAITNVIYDFSNTLDSNGASWVDNESLSLPVGTSLLELLRQFADSGIDFSMVVNANGTFTLQSFVTEKGSNLSETVYFRVGTNCEEVSEDKQGARIKNVLQMKWRDGFAKVTDPTSITAYRRREDILNIEAAQSAASATTYGSARIDGLKDPKRSLPIKIYDGITPYAFVSYNIGDYITIDRFGVEASERIRGMQLSFNEAGYAIITITLNDTIYENEINFGRDLDWLMKQWNTAHDADLLEVSYWAAIGEPDVTYNTLFAGITNSKLYLVQSASSGNRIYEYDIINGGWQTFRDIDISQFNHSACIMGTDIYIGGLFVIYKFDTLTETLTTLTATFDAATPLSSITSTSLQVGTKVYFRGNWTSIGTLVNPVGIAEYDTVANIWADIQNGIGGMPVSIRSDGTYLYMVLSNELYRYVGGSWVQLGTFPENANNISSNIVAYDAGIIVAAGTELYYWDGTAWTTLLTLSGTVSSIGVYLTDIYLSGAFTSEGIHITRYSGGAFWALETGLDADANIMLYQDNDNVDVYISGGLVTTAGDKPANEVAVYYNNFEALTDYLEHSSSQFNLGEAIHNATAKTPMVAADEIPLWDSITQRLRKITRANILESIKTYTDTLYVALTGNQTVAGIKTFTSFLVTPSSAPTTDYQVANKKYVDDNMGGGGGTWGSITGTLSAQTDLQTALDDKLSIAGHTAARIPYTDASGNIIESDNLIFNEIDGSLVIGDNGSTSAPALGIFHPNGNPTSWILTNFGGSIGAQYKGIGVGGTIGSPAAVTANRRLASLRGAGYDGVTAIENSVTSAEVRIVADETFDGSGHGSKIELWTTPNNSTTTALVATIGQDGNIDIATGKEYRVNGAQHTHAPLNITGLRFLFPFASYTHISPLTVTNSFPFSSTLPSFTAYPKQYSQAIYIGAGTNDATNYWKLDLIEAGTGTVIATVTTQSLATNAGYTLTDTTMGISSLTQGTHKYLYILATKILSPTSVLYVHAPAVEYELQ